MSFEQPISTSPPIERVTVMQGQALASAGQSIEYSTVLGSCVATCLYDPETRVGGMNHFLLSEPPANTPGAKIDEHYGVYLMELLINEQLKRGATRSTLEAKVFGGGAVISGMNTINVGERNTAFVLDYLKTEKIPIVAKDLLDSYPRKVYYFPETGRVLVKKLHRVHNETLFSRERNYKDRLSGSDVAGDVELFV